MILNLGLSKFNDKLGNKKTAMFNMAMAGFAFGMILHCFFK
jgi:hypothetical protein